VSVSRRRLELALFLHRVEDLPEACVYRELLQACLETAHDLTTENIRLRQALARAHDELRGLREAARTAA
jgi:hypothetical protein